MHAWEGRGAVHLKDGAGQELLAGARAGCHLFRQGFGSGSVFLEFLDPFFFGISGSGSGFTFCSRFKVLLQLFSL